MVRTSKVKMWRKNGYESGEADGHPQRTSFLRYFVLYDRGITFIPS